MTPLLLGVFFLLPSPALAAELPTVPESDTPEEMVRAEFEDAPVMLSIALCESGDGCKPPINPKAKNPHSSARGVFQITRGTWKYFECEGDPLDAADNIACARKIYDRNGTRDWNASKSVWSKKTTSL